MSARELFKVFNPKRITEIVDIGANPIDGDPPYLPFLQHRQHCRLTGFEPQAEALASLQRKKGSNERYLPYAVGDGTDGTLNVCQAEGMTSLFTPDKNTLEHFGIFSEFGKVKEQLPVSTRTLDSINEIDHLDFLKIDIQGGELSVFQHGHKKLAQTVAIQTEISFIPLYENQPTFAEIDLELRAQGFIPHCFAAMKNWIISPLVINGNPTIPLNQLMEADMVYVRNFMKPEGLSDEQLKHLGLIAHLCYKSFDLTMRCLMLLEQRGAVPKGTMANYPKLLSR